MHRPAMSDSKRLLVHFLRHGQATHNINAEALRSNGCSFEEFLAQMKADDEFDSKLTAAGIEQARAVGETSHAVAVRAGLDCVVSSPHSRAIHTADLVLPRCGSQQRILREEWRELSGYLDNARRATATELAAKYSPDWDCAQIPEQDLLWTPALENRAACAERAYSGLEFLFESLDDGASVAIAAHGGIFSVMFAEHPLIIADEVMAARFHNCELRSAVVTAETVVLGSGPDLFAPGDVGRESRYAPWRDLGVSGPGPRRRFRVTGCRD